MTILAIESSCDETSAAVLDDKNGLRSNIVASQTIHTKFGGVVPELASRAHQRKIYPTVLQALEEAGIGLQDLSHIAVTQGPGLIGALLVGVCFAKGLAQRLNIPLIGVNHVDAHLYAGFLERPKPSFPFLGLVVSGGHTQIMKITKEAPPEILGKTLDDAAGEAFDKTGKMLGLAYPAGAEMDKLANVGNPMFHTFPKSMLNGTLDFSFSGLKTSVLYFLQKFEKGGGVIDAHKNDICASITEAITEVLSEKVVQAVQETGIREVVVAGGVSANSILKRKLLKKADNYGFSVNIPAPVYCTDNAAMIAAAALYNPQSHFYEGRFVEECKPFASYNFQKKD